MKLSPATIKEKLEKVNHFINMQTATTVFLAIRLKRPILIEGPAGVGKTSLALAISKAFDYEFLKLQCYEGIDESKALYDWEYSKQLLYTQILKEKFKENFKEKNLTEILKDIKKSDSLFFSENFLIERPVLKAIRNHKKSLLLIDEIDKSEPQFEAFLLEVLSDFTISIPEIGIIKSTQIPLVILTSNAQRVISDALRRRALFLYLDYPEKELEIKIIQRKVPDLSKTDAEKLIELMEKIRKYPLKKLPGTSESIDWAKSMLMIGGINKENIMNTVNIISKHKSDADYIKNNIDTLI